MFIDRNSIVINGVSMGQYLLQAEYQFNKLWGEDSGRNLAGKMVGTLIGVFPKLVLTFRKLSKEELNVIAPILDSANQSVSYYDPTKNAMTSMTTYTGDYEISAVSLVLGKEIDIYRKSFNGYEIHIFNIYFLIKLNYILNINF